MSVICSRHTVGLLIRRDLNVRHGLYSRRLPIAADQLFVKTALMLGATIARAYFIASEFSVEGMSGLDAVGQLIEVFRSQLATERFLLPQYVIFMLRRASTIAGRCWPAKGGADAGPER